MSYVESNLLPKEKVVSSGKVSNFIFLKGVACTFVFPAIILSSNSENIVGIWSIAFGIVFLINAAIVKHSTELAVTNKRIIAKYGLIARNTVELNLSKVESLSVDQTILGRILNYGTVTINGTGGIRTPFKFIDDPLSIRRIVNEQLEASSAKAD